MRNYLIIAVLVTLFAVGAPPLLAKEDQGAKKKEGEKHASHGEKMGVEKGLFMGAIEVTLWTIVVFVTLFLVLSRTAWGPIKEGLMKREQSILRDKQEAIAAREEAGKLRQQLEAEMARVNDQIRTMMDKARQDAEKTAADEIARGKTELQAERQRLQREMGMARDQALHDIWNQAAQLATLISAKAVRKQLSYDDHRALLDESLGEFKQALETRKSELEGARA